MPKPDSEPKRQAGQPVARQEVIVAGVLMVKPEHRAFYLDAHIDLINRARAQAACLHLSLTADPLKPEQVILLERWTSAEELARWRARADPPNTSDLLLGSEVNDYLVYESRSAS